MTTKNEKNDDKAPKDDEKSKKVTEKLKTMGVMSPDKNQEDKVDKVDKVEIVAKEERRISPLLVTLLIAIPLAGFIIYLNMPDQFNKWTSYLTGSSSSSSSASAATDSATGISSTDSQLAFQNGQWDRPISSTSTGAGTGTGSSQDQQAQWIENQRADMEKRRQAFEDSNPVPDWVKKQREESDLRRQEFEKQQAENYAANWSRQPVQPEPPQWVKDKQAEMEREMANYQKNWSNQANPQAYNSAPGFMRHPGMNPYQQNGPGNYSYQQQPRSQPQQQQQQRQIQNPANGYAQPQRQYYNSYNYPPNPYYNAPYNGYHPNNTPYGRYGYPY